MLLEVGQQVYHEKSGYLYRVKEIKDLNNVHIERRYRVKEIKDLNNVHIERSSTRCTVAADTLSKPVFKVGDKAICRKEPISRDAKNSFVLGMKNSLNKVGTVTSLHQFPSSEGDWIRVDFANDGVWNYLPEWIEHYVEEEPVAEEKPKFKIGDKIICQKIPTVRSPFDPYFSDTMKGELLQQIGVVKDVYSKTVNVNFPQKYPDSKWSYLTEWLEHAPEEVTETTTEPFKIPKSEILSISTKPEIKKRLKEIAKKQDKSISLLVNETLTELIVNETLTELIVKRKSQQEEAKPKSSGILATIWKKICGTIGG